MYAVVAFFDDSTEQYLNDVWRELREQSISHYSVETQDKRPHITLASYGSLDKERFIQDMDAFYDRKPAVDIMFNVLGMFLNTGTLFLSPTLSQALLGFHNSHHKHFSTYNNDPNSLYVPGKWVPHCTIASRLDADKLKEAFQHCSQKIDTLHARIKKVALLEFMYEDNKLIGAPPVFIKELES
ncbi:2'-5' RNA ligase family protein [Bacillus sp. 165]|uniref:2'-5' RNA ligase family protein n=1 Tax=Bacillus sp. 165 TaxID=1529117 RepID=UPI001ADC2E07|nr:2'-5' RNA ligase family protein [Bacillus sp. 165]MBO9129520.1 2'-5' RNA ligase family protein [Bacillus sp. 165]